MGTSRVWTFDDKGDLVLSQITEGATTATTFTAPGKRVSYTHTAVQMDGTYDATQTMLKLVYATNSDGTAGTGFANMLTLPIDPGYDTALVAQAASYTGTDVFAPSDANAPVAFTVAADGKFSGSAGTGTAKCDFSGTLTQTGKSYESVSITFGTGCNENVIGQTGSGVLVKRGDLLLLMTQSTGNFMIDAGFAAYLTPGGTAPAMKFVRRR
jgi:hypothetical protein